LYYTVHVIRDLHHPLHVTDIIQQFLMSNSLLYDVLGDQLLINIVYAIHYIVVVRDSLFRADVHTNALSSIMDTFYTFSCELFPLSDGENCSQSSKSNGKYNHFEYIFSYFLDIWTVYNIRG